MGGANIGRRLAGVAAIVCVACGSSSSPTGPGGGGGGGGEGGGGTGGGAPSSCAQACDLLAPADLMAVTGASVTPKPSTLTSNDNTCAYEPASGKGLPVSDLTVFCGENMTAHYDTLKSALNSTYKNVVEVPGLGLKAIRGSLYPDAALTGDTAEVIVDLSVYPDEGHCLQITAIGPIGDEAKVADEAEALARRAMENLH